MTPAWRLIGYARKLKIASSSVRNWIDDRNTEVVYRSKHDTDPATREKRTRRHALAEEDGLSYREIAERLGMRVQTVRATAYRQGWKATKKVKRYDPRPKTDRGRTACTAHRQPSPLSRRGTPRAPPRRCWPPWRGIIALADVTAQAQFMVYKDLAVLLDIGYDTRTLRNGSGWRVRAHGADQA